MSFLCCHTQTEYSYHVVMFCPHKQHEKGHPQMTSQILSLWHINLAFVASAMATNFHHRLHINTTFVPHCRFFFSLSIAEVCNALHTTQTEADKERTQMFSSNPMWDTTTAATTTATHFNAPQPLFSAKWRTTTHTMTSSWKSNRPKFFWMRSSKKRSIFPFSTLKKTFQKICSYFWNMNLSKKIF